MNTGVIDAIGSDVVAAQDGDKQALVRLLTRTRNTVSCIALAIVKDLDASEDVTQDVFVQVWQQLHTLKNSASFLPWIRQLTRRRALNYLRTNKVKERLSSEEAEHLLASYSTYQSTEQEFERNEQNLLVRHLLLQLPTESHELVLLYYREDQSSAHVATLLGMPEATIRKRLQRVRESLKEAWLKQYGSAVVQSALPATFVAALLAKGVLTTAAPASVAMGSAYAAGQSSTWIGKLLWLLGGAFLAALVAVVGVIAGMHGPIKMARNAQERNRLIGIRNYTVAWVALGGMLLTAAYAFSAGWLLPVLAYLALIAGLVRQNRAVWGVIGPRLRAEAKQSREGLKRYKSNLYGALLGMTFGYGGGFAGLMLGMWQSGRFLQLL